MIDGGIMVGIFYQLPVCQTGSLPEHKTWEFLVILEHIPVGDVSQIIHDFLFFGERVVVLPADDEVKYDGDLLLTDTSRVAVC